jgi:hypothetical protein
MVVSSHTISSGETIVGAVDATGADEEFIIADISVDGAWLSMQAEEAPTLLDYR